MKKVIKVGVMSFEDFRRRSIDIAAGRHKPKANEPRIWFESLKSLAEVLSEGNQELLDVIRREKPVSLAELSQMTGRAVPNLSRTLRKMEQHGIVELRKEDHSIKPIVMAERFEVRAEI